MSVSKKEKEVRHKVNQIEVKEIKDDSDIDVGLVVRFELNSIGATAHSDSWIVDSGATCHMS